MFSNINSKIKISKKISKFSWSCLVHLTSFSNTFLHHHLLYIYIYGDNEKLTNSLEKSKNESILH